jgi:hypothetical protein
MTRPDPDKLRVLWQKGRNYFTSFFIELENIRREIGNDKEFASWCFMDFHVGLDALVGVSDVLKATDAKIIKRELATALELEKEERKAKREEEKARKAQAAAEKAQKQVQKKKEASHERKKERDRKYRKKKKEEVQALWVNSVPQGNGHDLEYINDEMLITEIKKAMSNLGKSRQEWIEASIELASRLCQAKNKYPGKNEFGDWLRHHEIGLDEHDRIALLNLGKNLAAMRLALSKTKRNSYQLIWRDVKNELQAPECLAE